MRNEIIFKTVAFVLFSFVAILVSWKANSIYAEQVRIMKLENAPFLYFNVGKYASSTINKSGSSASFFYEELVVSNKGGPLKELNSDVVTAYVRNSRGIDYDGRDLREIGDLIKVVPDYYIQRSSYNNPTGELQRFVSRQIEDTQAEELINNLEGSGKLYGEAVVKDELCSFVRLQYKDIFDESYERFYSIDPYGSVRELPQEDGERIFKQYYEKLEGLVAHPPDE